MAIDTNQPIRQVSVEREGRVVLIRHGQDDGAFAPAGTVVVEDDGRLRLATPAEASNYTLSNTRDALDAALQTRAGAIDVPAPTPLAIKEYLKAKFPGDFA